MAHDQKTKNRAFEMFCQGKGHLLIGREVNVCRATISAWKKKYNWIERRNKIRHKVDEKQSNKIISRDVRQLEIIDATYDKYMEDLMKGRVRMTAGGIKALMEQDRLLRGLSTERKEEIILRWKKDKPVKIKTEDIE